MKIIHCADLHLDSRMETNLSTEQAAKRRRELLMTFEKMVDYAVDTGVKVVIIAGDLFDTVTGMQKKIKTRVLEVIRNASEIDFLYLRGNHDKDEDFCNEELKPENLKFFGSLWKNYQYEDICISGREMESADGLADGLVLREENINIVVLHGIASQNDGKSDTYIIPMNSLKNKYIDYLALGHIHSCRCERLDKRGVYCYSGCLEGRGFDECGKKGFVLLDIEGRNIQRKFVSVAARTCHEIPVDIALAEKEADILNLVGEQIKKIPEKDMVKVVLRGEVISDLEIDTEYLEEHLCGNYFLFKIKDETRLKINYADYENDISLKGEFIRQVQELDISQEDKEKVILTGIRALMGRELDE